MIDTLIITNHPMSNGDDIQRTIAAVLASIATDAGGGCPLHKALYLARLIGEHRLHRVVEIGVYRSRSLLAMAHAVRQSQDSRDRQQPSIISVDPYDAQEAREPQLEREHPDVVGVALRDWYATTPFDSIHDGVRAAIATQQLSDVCDVIRLPSKRAVDAVRERFGSAIDLLHIDGNHDAAAVVDDVRLYAPMVVENGFVVMDDTHFSTVQPALITLRDCGFTMYHVADDNLWQVWRRQTDAE